MSTVVISPKWGLKRSLIFNTTAQETAAFQGSVYVPNAVYNKYKFTMDLPLLEGRIDDPNSSVAQFLGLFMQAKGRAGTFLYSDPQDNTVTDYQIGIGDGDSQAFQLTRPVGGAVDIVQNLNGTPTIKIDGTPTSAYSESRGLITFDEAPANEAVITWTGSFYFRLRFTSDTLADLTLFFGEKWSIDGIEFESVIL